MAWGSAFVGVGILHRKRYLLRRNQLRDLNLGTAIVVFDSYRDIQKVSAGSASITERNSTGKSARLAQRRKRRETTLKARKEKGDEEYEMVKEADSINAHRLW